MIDFKKLVSILIIVLVNFLFLIKYVERVTSYYVWISLIIVVGYYLIYHFRKSLTLKVITKNRIPFLLLVGYILLSIVLFNLIPQSTLNVDRYSVITSFWDRFLDSEYAYAAKSHQGNFPGPMPFYFLLAFPFYLIGELGYFSLLGLLVFYVGLKYSKIQIDNQISGLLLVILSAFYMWEILSRSNIFLNSSLLLLSILFFIKTLNIERKKHVLIHGVLIGLLLSTRNVLLIPYIVLFLFLLKNKMYGLIDVFKISILITITFVLTFLPFVMNHVQSFLEINPFIVQSSFLMPTWLSFICIALTFVSFFCLKQLNEIFFLSGIFLFVTILMYFSYQIVTHGFQNALFGSKTDISYFILCVPFLLYYVLEEKKAME